MTRHQAERQAASIKAAAAEAVRRIRVEMEADKLPCTRPFCTNRRYHLSGSGKCVIAPAPICRSTD